MGYNKEINMVQKIIRVGNSLAVTLPKSFTDKVNFKAGDDVSVETNEGIRAIYIRANSAMNNPGLTPEFKDWLDSIAEGEKDVIKSLAKV
jgi:antitoxin component of MazEF toxin-antitoxin module